MKQLGLRQVQVKNFKAVRDSGVIKLTPLTVFIGNNGSGKSSLIEALETYQLLVTKGLDVAMQRWRGFENIRNKAMPHIPQNKPNVQSGDRPNERSNDRPNDRPSESNPIEFHLRYQLKDEPLKTSTIINVSPNADDLFIQHECFAWGKDSEVIDRDAYGNLSISKDKTIFTSYQLSDGESIISPLRMGSHTAQAFAELVSRWQFVQFNPDYMGIPQPQSRTGGAVRLRRDGANIAEYLLDIRRQEPSAYDGIIETLQYVLPYALDLQSRLTSELERAVYLQMSEGEFTIPGWLLSSGTLRIVSILALLRHPNPSPLIVIEEIENGLDPRTIHLVVEELRNVIEMGNTQVIVTTHSPYLLDLLSLSHLVLVERIDDEPAFWRPADQKSLAVWKKDFGPGQLYTMGKLSRERES